MRAIRTAAGVMLPTLAVAVLVGWGCYNPNFVSGVTKCSPSGACPNDWVCRSGVCVDASAGGVGGAAATGGHGGGTATGGAGGSSGHGGGGGTATGGTGAATGGVGGSSGHGGGGGTATGGAGGRGAGGGIATGGVTGTGGTTLDCLQGAIVQPVSSLITNFSDAMPDPNHSGEYLFGTTSGDPGGTSRYASGTIGTFTLSGGALTYAATLEAPTTSDMFPYSGFAVYLTSAACIDARAYTGIAFSLNVTGNCPAYLMFSDSEHLTMTNDPLRGACVATSTSSCFASQFSVTSSTTSVAFDATPVNAGQPTAAVDPGKLTGVQWQFGVPSGSAVGCSGTITVANIHFY
jgi:hypothetical protein